MLRLTSPLRQIIKREPVNPIPGTETGTGPRAQTRDVLSTDLSSHPRIFRAVKDSFRTIRMSCGAKGGPVSGIATQAPPDTPLAPGSSASPKHTVGPRVGGGQNTKPSEPRAETPNFPSAPGSPREHHCSNSTIVQQGGRRGAVSKGKSVT